MKHLLFLSCSLLITLYSSAQSQYASSVIAFSTEWSPTNWSAAQTLGAPNTVGCGDITTSWASSSADGAREWLVLGFTTPQQVGVINIWETWNPGAVDTIYLRNSSTGLWNTVYTATAAPALPCPRTFTITIPTTAYTVDAIRLAINSPLVSSWNEIDAVEIQLNCSTSVSTTNNPLACFGNCNATATANPSGPGPYTYLWAPGNQSTQTISNICAGTYTVTVTDANMCTSTATVTITEPAQLIVNIPSTQVCSTACNGSLTANVTGGTPPYTYLWNPSFCTTQTCTGLCAGSYIVQVTDANGCTAFGNGTVTNYPALIPNMTCVPVDCFSACNGSATASPTGGCGAPYTFLWMPGGWTTSSISNLCSGVYTVIITDQCGCTGSQTCTVTFPTALTVTASATPETCPGCCDGTASGSVTGGTAPYTYVWTPASSTTQNMTGLCPAIYTLCVTDAAGCSVCDTAMVMPSTVGIGSIPDQMVQINPNPFSNSFSISFGSSAEGECSIQLFDVTGRMVYSEKRMIKSGSQEAIEPDVPPGVYLLELFFENHKTNYRIVKK